MLTKNEIKALNDLISKEGVAGKKLLRRVLWLNTSEKKFQIGDYVKVSRSDMLIGGKRVIDVNCKVTEYYTIAGEWEWFITAEATFKTPAGTKKFTIPAREAEFSKSDTDVNYIECADPAEAIEVSL